MAGQPTALKNVLRKGVVGAVLGGILVGASKALGFPPVFQGMFFVYAMLGTLVFILLDAPPLKPISGIKAAVALVGFYVVISGVYIGGASLLPQYDPEDEKGKIEKLLRAKRAETEKGKAEELVARTKALSEKADGIMQRLQAIGGEAMAAVPESTPGKPRILGTGGDLVALGKEQWDLQECYNCHKLFGEGGKKRGPELDNIGNLMTPEELREKILYPLSWMAEGFEKDYDKKKMPDKYRELMEDSEVNALVVFLSTLKNPSVNTPKPIKKK